MRIITRKLYAAAIMLYCSSVAFAQDENQVFQYPVPPESIEDITERSTYIIEHFWDRCNLKSLFSHKKNFETAFNRYIAVIPFADTTVVNKSVAALIKEVKKTPANLQTMASMARAKLYSDSAEYYLDEVYIPFARAAANTGGISKEEKDEYLKEVSRLNNSKIGYKAADFTMTTRDGQTLSLNSMPTTYLLIFFDDPDDFNNMLSRTRLASDYGLNELISDNQVTVLSLYPGEPDAAWRERASTYPENWIVAASPEADMLFDRRWTPTCYYLNKDHVIMSKSLSAESLVEGFRKAYDKRKQNKEERDRLRREAVNGNATAQ